MLKLSFVCVYFSIVIYFNKKLTQNKSKKGKIRAGFSAFARAASQRPLTGAVPLLRDTGTLACWVSPLGRCVPPQATWTPRAPPGRPYRCRAQRGHPIYIAPWKAGAPPSRRPPTQASRQRDYRSAPPLPARTRAIVKYITHLRKKCGLFGIKIRGKK